MLKIVAVLGLLLVVSADNEMLAPPSAAVVSQEDKLSKVVMPKMENNGLLQSVDASKCLDKKIYKDQDTLLKVKEEKDYLCAFIAFQANKDVEDGVGLYTSRDESTDRYKIFKETVKMVNDINSQNLSYTTEVNKFADMTEAERAQRLGFGPIPGSPGGAKLSSSGGLGSSGGFGSGFGSPPGDNAGPPSGFGSSAGGRGRGRGLGMGAPPRQAH